LVGALVLIVATAGAAVALLRIADRRDAERAAGRAGAPTTVPSAGLDREPSGGSAPPGTATAPTAARPGPATTAGEGPPVVLKGDGVGAFIFGADPDQVIAGLTLRWGPPDGDSGWIAAPTSPYGPCPGNVVRGVNWRGFTVLFSDGATPRGQAGTRHFFTWEYQVDNQAHPAPDKGGNRPPLKTVKGISVGATVQALKAAYGDPLELFDEPPDGPQFGVETPEGALYGSVTSLDPAGVVRSIVSGGACAKD
jgi:hypothetical protein